MEFIHIYLLVFAAIFSITAVIITRISYKDTVLKSPVPNVIQKYIQRLEHDLLRSRLKISVQEYLTLKIGCPAILVFTAYFLSENQTLMLIFIALGFMLPSVFLILRKQSENRKFEDRFVRALSQMAASLHSGMTVEQSIDSVVRCELLHEDIRDDFKILSSKMKLGMPLSQAFYEFAEMTENKDTYDVATSITIMLEVGGDAGNAIEKIQKNIEDRLLYRKKRESMLTESKMIAVVSDVMPLLILAGMYVLMPESINAFFRTQTMTMIFVIDMLVLLLGSVVVHKMLSDKMDAS